MIGESDDPEYGIYTVIQAAVDASPPLSGRCILVVEDDFLVAQELVDTLRREGADIVGAAPSVRTALALIHSTPQLDAAVIDVNLRGELAYPVVDAMIERRRPFVFATVCRHDELPQKYRDAPRCAKPLQRPVLLRKLQGALVLLPPASPVGVDAAYRDIAAAPAESTASAMNKALTGWIGAIAAQGDIAAYSAIFLAVAPKIKRYMLDNGATDKVAEEATRDALLGIWREASEFGHSQTAKMWFFTVARDLKSKWLG